MCHDICFTDPFEPYLRLHSERICVINEIYIANLFSTRDIPFPVPFVTLKASFTVRLRKSCDLAFLVLVGCHIPLSDIYLIYLNGYIQ